MTPVPPDVGTVILGQLASMQVEHRQDVERLEGKVDDVHGQTVKTNGRVTALEAAEIRREAIEQERARVAVELRQTAADAITTRTFKERWLDRALTIALTLGAAGIGSLLHVF